ncbi:uncharacterized protein AB9W97_001982 [Spinachia spinachia]
MVSEVSLRVSWICLLMFSSGACFPFKNEYKYPYARVSTSPAPASEHYDGSRPEKTAQSGPAVYRPLAAGTPTGNQSPNSKTTGSSPTYQLNQYVVAPDSSATRAGPVAPPKLPGSSAYAPPAGEALRNSPPGPYQARPAAGAESSSHNRMQSWFFPHFNVWGTAAVMLPRHQARPSGPSRSTVIIQSRNGYWRASELSSRSRYTPEYPRGQV